MTTATDKGNNGMEAIQTDKIILNIATLFHNGTITSKTACQLLGISRRQFEEDVLPKFDYTHIRDDSDNIQIELEAAKR